MSFDRACTLLESALATGARGALLESVGARHGGSNALRRLCAALDTNFRPAGADGRELYVCGGGACNPGLMRELAYCLQRPVHATDALGVPDTIETAVHLILQSQKRDPSSLA